MENTKKIYRNPNNKVVAGVCSGLGEYFSIDPVIVRLIWAASILFMGFGVLAYLVAWIIIPERN